MLSRPALVMQPAMPGGAVSPRCWACAMSSWLSAMGTLRMQATPESLLKDFASLLVFGSEALNAKFIAKLFAAPTIQIAFKLFRSTPDVVAFLKGWWFDPWGGPVYTIVHLPEAGEFSHAMVIYGNDELFQEGVWMMDPMKGYVFWNYQQFVPRTHYLMGVPVNNNRLTGAQWGTRPADWIYP
jgi:hypothetical protein